MKTIAQTLALRTAFRLLSAAGFNPHFDIRVSNSTKDVIGARVKRFNSVDDLHEAEVTMLAKPGAKVALRLYAEIDRKVVTDKFELAKLAAGRLSTIASAQLPLDPKVINVEGAPTTELTIGGENQVGIAQRRTVIGVMGNIRAHNGAPPMTMGAVSKPAPPPHLCDGSGDMKENSAGDYLPTCSICGDFK